MVAIFHVELAQKQGLAFPVHQVIALCYSAVCFGMASPSLIIAITSQAGRSDMLSSPWAFRDYDMISRRLLCLDRGGPVATKANQKCFKGALLTMTAVRMC